MPPKRRLQIELVGTAACPPLPDPKWDYEAGELYLTWKKIKWKYIKSMLNHGG